MHEFDVMGVKVQAHGDPKDMPAVKAMAEAYIKDRFSRPAVLFGQPGRDECAMRFANADEKARLRSMKSIEIDAAGTKCKAYPMYGLKPSDISRTDLEAARSLWTEPVFIDMDEAGRPFIDD